MSGSRRCGTPSLPNGLKSCRRADFELTQLSTLRRPAEMRSKCGVRFRIIEHRIECRRKWRQLSKSGEDGSISNFRVEHEGGPLRHLQPMEIGRVGPNARFDCGRPGALEQFL